MKEDLDWLTVREAAVTSRKSSSQILRLMELGRLRGRRDGQRWLIAATDVERLARGDTTPPILGTRKRGQGR